MKTLIKLAWRNIWRNKRRSYISIASVLFAVMFAISADSFERGSYENMISNMVKLSTGYIQIQDVLYEDEPSIDNIMIYDEEIEKILAEFGEEISLTVPRIQNFALLATENKTRGAMIIGIDPESENKFNSLSENIIEGDYLETADEGVLIAKGLSEILGLKVGDTIVALGQGFQGVNASGLYPIKGIVDLNVPDLNNNAVYMSLETAQWFFAADERISSLIIMPVNPKHTKKLAKQIEDKLDKEWYRALTWEQMLSDFLRMMEIDRAGSKMIIYILYIVIAFGLFGTILTMMLERIREFAMLIAIGMKKAQLALVCLMESIFLSFIGVFIGIFITFPIVYYFNVNPIRLTGEMADVIDQYGFEPIMPTSIASDIFISQAVAIFVIAFLIGLYPVYKVFKLKVIQEVK